MKGIPDIHITNAFKENQMFIGIRQGGKTNTSAYFLSLTTLPYTVWDEVGAFSRMLRPLNPRAQRIINPNAIIPKTSSSLDDEIWHEAKLDLFRKTCRQVMEEGNRLMVIDEVHQYCTKRTIDKALENVITLGGNRNVGVICTSQSVRQVHNTILGNTTHFFIMKTFLKPDIDWLSAFIPKEVISLSQTLPQYAYIYYRIGEKPLIGSPVKKMELS